MIFLMEEILHQQYGNVSYCFIGFHIQQGGDRRIFSIIVSDVSLQISTGPDPRKRPSIPPAWNAGPGVKVPKDHRPQGVATVSFWEKIVSFGVFSYVLGLKI